MDGLLHLFVTLRRVLASCGRSGDDIDDLMQEAFLRLQAYGRDHTVHNAEAFLVRTALNLSAEQARKVRPGRQVWDERLVVSLVDPAPSPDELYARLQRAARMKQGLARLNPRPRQVLLLHRVEGLSHAQIAARLGISVSMVEKHISRAAFFLRDWMARSPE